MLDIVNHRTIPPELQIDQPSNEIHTGSSSKNQIIFTDSHKSTAQKVTKDREDP